MPPVQQQLHSRALVNRAAYFGRAAQGNAVGVAKEATNKAQQQQQQQRERRSQQDDELGAHDKAYVNCDESNEQQQQQQPLPVIDEMPARAAAGAADAMPHRAARQSLGGNLCARSERQASQRSMNQQQTKTDQVEGGEQPSEHFSYSAPFAAPLLSSSSASAHYSSFHNNDDDDDDGDFLLSSQADESVELILWYHSSLTRVRPIYSVDARTKLATTNNNNYHSGPSSTQNNSSEHFVPVLATPFAPNDNQQQQQQLNYNNSTGANTYPKFMRDVVSKRAKHFALAKLSPRLRLKMSQWRAYLIIDKLEADDAGQYKCRVDFKFARTRYQLSQLEVISK